MTRGEHAAQYASWGWAVLPCHWIEAGVCSCGDPGCKSPGKHPLARLVPRGLHQASSDPLVVGAWWQQEPNANVAIRTGGAARLVVIDIDPRHDGDATLAEWQKVNGRLPDTAEVLTGGGGRHLYYVAPAGLIVPSRTNILGSGVTGVDGRGEGGYVLAPSSNHVSGQEYTWEFSCEEVSELAELPVSLVRALGQAPAADPTPAAAEERLSPEKVQELRSALAFIPADDRDTWLQVGMALESTRAGEQAYGIWTEWSQTSEKFDARDQRRVWRSFRPDHGITLSSLFWKAKAAGWIQPTGAVAVQAAEEPQEAGPPAELLSIPGVLQEFVSWALRSAVVPQPQFAVQGALALGSVVCGRAYQSDRGNWTPLILLCVGPTGSGKEIVKTLIERVLYEAQQTCLLGGSGYTSGNAVTSALYAKPAHITIMDEMGMVLSNAGQRGNWMAQDVVKQLMEMFSRCNGILVPQQYATATLTAEQREQLENRVVHNPCLTVLGMSTPSEFYGALSSAQVKNGFLNRLICVQTCTPYPDEQDVPGRIQVPPALVEWIQAARRPNGNLPAAQVAGIEPSPRDVTYSDGAVEIIKGYRAEIRAEQRRLEANGDGTSAMLARCPEIAMRIATIGAVSTDPERPVILPEIQGWAVEYVRFYTRQTISVIDSHMASSRFEAVQQVILRVLKARGSKGLLNSDFGRISELRAIGKRERQEALDLMAESGRIIVEQTTGPKGGRPSQRYRLAVT